MLFLVTYFQYSLHTISPTCCSANCSTFSRRNLMSAGLANAYMDSQKLDTILCEPYSYYNSASVTKWAQKQSQNFLGEHIPRSPPPKSSPLWLHFVLASYSGCSYGLGMRLHSVHEITVPISWSPQCNWWGLVSAKMCPAQWMTLSRPIWEMWFLDCSYLHAHKTSM